MIEDIIKTLNAVEVHGKTNLAMMLGCINALEELAKKQNDVNDIMQKI